MLAHKLVVNVSDAKILQGPHAILTTYSLGSCIGVSLFDPDLKIGGLLHYQLPDSKLDPDKAKKKPFMFADSGMNVLIHKLLSLGVNRKRLQVKIAGGAAIGASPNGFEIGKRNHLAIRKYAWREKLFIDAEDIGGSTPRNMSVNLDNGLVFIKAQGSQKHL